MDLSKITSVSRWQLPLFDGVLHIEGRILSVTEAEAAGLTSALILAAMSNPAEMNKVNSLKGKKKEAYLYDMAKRIKPHQIAQLNEANDKIICQVIKRGSTDGGKNWSTLKVVTAEEQQDPEENILWVGVLNETDRQSILDKALEGHKEAVARIANFRKR